MYTAENVTKTIGVERHKHFSRMKRPLDDAVQLATADLRRSALAADISY